MTDHELKEEESHESGPQSSDTPDGDTLDPLIRLVILSGRYLPVLLGGFEASPHEVMYDGRHAGSYQKRKGSLDDSRCISVW